MEKQVNRTMDDLISRADAIKAVEKYYADHKYITRSRTTLSAICEDMKGTINALPSAQRTGKWIIHEYAEESEGLLIPNYECSECHTWERKESDYCPNCGARMVEE